MSQDIILAWLVKKFPEKYSKKEISEGSGVNIGTAGTNLQSLFKRKLIEKIETVPDRNGCWVFWRAVCHQ